MSSHLAGLNKSQWWMLDAFACPASILTLSEVPQFSLVNSPPPFLVHLAHVS